MRTFTPTEIDLCKKIAEKERKEITKGDYYSYQDKIYLRSMPFMETEDVAGGIKIWQEHDCLEFLDKTKDITIRICSYPETEEASIEYDDVNYYGDTVLEALLKAVLVVMEGK